MDDYDHTTKSQDRFPKSALSLCGCQETGCRARNQDILETFKSRGTYYHIQTLSENDLVEIALKSTCSAFLVCCHTKRFTEGVIERLDSCHKGCSKQHVVLGSWHESNNACSASLEPILLNVSEGYKAFISTVEHFMVEEGEEIYEDLLDERTPLIYDGIFNETELKRVDVSEVDDRYVPYGELGNTRKRTEVRDNTNVKTAEKPKDNGRDNVLSGKTVAPSNKSEDRLKSEATSGPTPKRRIRRNSERFVESQTLHQTDHGRGVHIWEDACMSQVPEEYNMDTTDLVVKFNSTRDKDDLAKYILSSILPSYCRTFHLNGMAQLLQCNSSRVKMAVLDKLQARLLLSGIEDASGQNLTDSVGIIFDECMDTIQDVVCFRNCYFILVCLLGKVYIASLTMTSLRNEGEQVQVKSLLEHILTRISKVEKRQRFDAIRDTFLSTLQLLSKSIMERLGSPASYKPENGNRG